MIDFLEGVVSESPKSLGGHRRSQAGRTSRTNSPIEERTPRFDDTVWFKLYTDAFFLLQIQIFVLPLQCTIKDKR